MKYVAEGIDEEQQIISSLQKHPWQAKRIPLKPSAKKVFSHLGIGICGTEIFPKIAIINHAITNIIIFMSRLCSA
ncbi:MAG: hypothetical protein DBX63_09995 [Clostridia bacterium]|nr:MAG: hypothetical protein DBX63_09995 [Clostridia bacterium]